MGKAVNTDHLQSHVYMYLLTHSLVINYNNFLHTVKWKGRIPNAGLMQQAHI